MKYLLYRSFGNLDMDVKKHELVAVEYGIENLPNAGAETLKSNLNEIR